MKWIVSFGTETMHWHIQATQMVLEPEYNRITFRDENGLVGNLVLDELKYMHLVRDTE